MINKKIVVLLLILISLLMIFPYLFMKWMEKQNQIDYNSELYYDK